MRGPWRPLALAAVLHVAVALGVSTAQTVIVTKAQQGSTVELSLNAETLGSTTVDASGIATLDVDLAAHGGKNETDVRFYLDSCNNLRSVRIVEAGSQPPPLSTALRNYGGVSSSGRPHGFLSTGQFHE